jgi:hypothetical protein
VARKPEREGDFTLPGNRNFRPLAISLAATVIGTGNGITAALARWSTLRHMERQLPQHRSPGLRRRPFLYGLIVLAQYLALVAAGTFMTVMVLRNP